MTTGKFISQLETLIKKLESLVQSLPCSSFHHSQDRYQAFQGLGLRLAECATNLPTEIDTLKKRLAEPSVEEGRKLIVQAQSEKRDLIATAQLKNRAIFARNISYFFDYLKDSITDSETTKVRKQLTRERCEHIRTLGPDGLISWAVALIPTVWTANSMSKDTFDYVFEHIESDDSQVWPPDIYRILSGLGAEEPLRGSRKYHEFLKAAEDEKKEARSSNQPRKRRRIVAGTASEFEPLPPVQTSELGTQTPASQYTSGRSMLHDRALTVSNAVQLPGLRQMALVPPSLNRGKMPDREDLPSDNEHDGTFDVDKERHQNVHPSSMRYVHKYAR